MTPHRYLLGPVSAERAHNWDGPRADGRCLAFNAHGDMDLTIGPNGTWADVLPQLPRDWRPDFLVLELAYQTIPLALLSAPVPVLGLAADWNLNWHCYRHVVPHLDLVFTDRPGMNIMRRAGWHHARPANLYGLERPFRELLPDGERDIDVLFVGNLHPAVQRERLPWIARLARLAERHRVVIRTGVFGDAYRALLARARIVFNRSIRGECNQRVLETVAAGALLFQEAGNAEVARHFQAGVEYVAYTDDDLEMQLDHYLTHEEERRSLAEAAQRRLPAYYFEALWEGVLQQVAEALSQLQERAQQRPNWDPQADLHARTWQALSAHHAGDPNLAADLTAALAARPHGAMLHNALGVAVALADPPGETAAASRPVRAATHFHRAVACDPNHAVAALNLIEALIGAGEGRLAAEGVRRLLAALDRLPALPPNLLDAPHAPPGFGHFRVEWERAAWVYAGDRPSEARAKRDLLRWRLRTLLADLTGDLVHLHEAVLARPDLPTTRAALGCALGRASRPADAVPHLRQALDANPFDRPAAQALHQALSDSGDTLAARRLARDRRLLHAAAPGVVRAEAWFTDSPPAGDELASLILLCCNEVECTRLCLESVLQHTRPPYELVLVDNGSTDATGAYLQQICGRPGPERVVVLTNATNRGFAAGCNQALTAARGRYVVFLNNDTVVTDGWLGRLIGWSLEDWPHVGLVGPVSNQTAAPQLVTIDYRDATGLEAFAARRARDYASKALAVPRLTGFCLLVRREVLDQIGGFDERFGPGFFEDDDLCVRAREAGFRLLVALDVHIHHFGSRTFTGLGIDCEQQLLANFGLFREKWGPEHARHYRLPDGSPVPTPPAAAEPVARIPASLVTGHVQTSLCLIVRDEEHNLPACLGPVSRLFDEVVVVDTGSTDRTREVAVGLGARVFDFPWCDDFAAARNEGLRHATGNWIFWLDADDRLDDENLAKLSALLAGLVDENVAYCMKCLCLPDAATGSATVVDHIRLFRHDPQVRWRYRVHEQILPAVRAQGGTVRWSDVVIQHTGYQDPALRHRKLDRDLRLLRLEDADRPDDPFTLFNLGSVYQELGWHAEAVPLLRRSLERSHPQDSIVRKTFALLVSCQRALGRPDEALAACQEGRQVYPDDTELLFIEGTMRREQGDLAGAEQCLLQLLGTVPPPHFASVDAGLRGYKARHNLAVVYAQQGRSSEAEARWAEAVAERPDFLPGWLGLAEGHLRRQDWVALEDIARRMETLPQGGPEAAWLRGRGHLARQAFAEARAVLEAGIARFPEALPLRIVLSYACLQEGRDWPAAERALLGVLGLDPGNAEAQHNLSVLRGLAPGDTDTVRGSKPDVS